MSTRLNLRANRAKVEFCEQLKILMDHLSPLIQSELCKGKEEDKIRKEFHLLLFFPVFVHVRAKRPLSLALGRSPGC